MKRMFDWLLEKQLERDRRREVRAMLRCFNRVMESKGGVVKCH